MEYKKIKLPFKVRRAVLALGSQTKNTVCLLTGGTAYLSCMHQGLSNPRDLLDFQKSARYFLRQKPRIIAHDLHPEYQSTKFALSLSPDTYNLTPIQHHHAHIASCMADNGLVNQKVIGVAFDGTGLGENSALWGAEFLLCDYKNFVRKVHLKDIPLIGGEQAIREPWRLAAAWLSLIYQDKFLNFNIGFIKKMNRRKWQVLKTMLAKDFNVPLASSMGRLFDAASALILEKYTAGFEGDLAMQLERLAGRYPQDATGKAYTLLSWEQFPSRTVRAAS